MATREERLRYLIQSVWQGKNATVAASRDFDQTTESVKKNKSALEDLKEGAKGAGEIISTVAAGAKIAWEIIGQGAAIETTTNRFDVLAKSIGTTADALLTNLRMATKGMITDAELMSSATDIINLGLGKNQEQVVRLATAISTLGLDMQQVILTFANNSKARLDALGLSVEGVTTKAKELEDQGFVGDAFDEAVIISLEEKMDQLEGTVSKTAVAMERLSTRAINAKDSVLGFVSVRVEPALSGYENFLNEVSKAHDTLDEALKRGLITQDDYNAMTSTGTLSLIRYGEVTEGLSRTIAFLETEEQKLIDSASRADQLFSNYTDTITDNAVATEDLTGFTEQWNDTVERQQALAMGAAEAMQFKADAHNRDTEAMKAAREAADAYDRHMASLFNTALESTDAIVSWNQSVIISGGLTSDQAANLDELSKEYEKVTDEMRSLQGGTAGLFLEQDKLNEELADAAEKAAILEGAISDLEGQQATVSGTTEGYRVNQEALNQELFDAAVAAGASDRELAILGVSLGVVSEEAATAALKTALITEGLHLLAQGALEDGHLTRTEIEKIQEDATRLVEEVNALDPLTWNTNAEEVIGEIQNIANQIEQVPRFVETVFSMVQSGEIPDFGGFDAPQAPSGDTGFAQGGSFTVPGSGPIDSQRVSFMATPGERVTVETPEQQRQRGAGGGGDTINIYTQDRSDAVIGQVQRWQRQKQHAGAFR